MLFDGADFKDWVLGIAGNIFIVILVVRSVGYFAKKEWGELVGHLIVAVFLVALIWFTDPVINLLKAIWGLISGQPVA